MIDERPSADKHAQTSAFAALKRVAKTGQIICFHVDSPGESAERSGVLLEILSDGLIIDSDSGTEWIPAQDIRVWRLPKSSPPIEAAAQQPSTLTIVALPEKLQTISKPDQSLAISALPTPVDLEILFAGDPVMVLPAATFDFPKLGKNVQQDINRWKNRCDYAQKVREPARMSQDVASISELAESLEQPSLHYLAGLLADFSGLGNARTRASFQNALELDQNYQEATTAMATLAIREMDWPNAAKFLLWAIRLDGPQDKTNLVRWLGQCVLRLNGEPIPPIGLLLSYELPQTARRLAISLIALVVKQDSDAYRAALLGGTEELRQIDAGNALFPLQDKIIAPVEQRPILPTLLTGAPDHDTSRRGRVSAYYISDHYGFIVEDSTGQTWVFNMGSIVSSSLRKSVLEGVVRLDVIFSGNIESQSGKYPLANKISSLSEDANVQVELPKRAPLRQRLRTIPRDNSFFAKAMEAEQLDQLDRAEGFYNEEVTRRGNHLKSAIKNLAALKNRKGKPEAAIELLDKHRWAFDEADLVSLDQMRVQFLVKARKFADAAQLLSRLAASATSQSKRTEYLRQEAYCFLASGDFDESIRKLQAIIDRNRTDSASLLLLSKVKEAKQSGQTPSYGAAGTDPDENDDLLSSLALGLSPLARRQLENCELRGLDARTRESSDFKTTDVKQVQTLLDGLKGRRPRERADYLLTLAWLCEHASNVTENRSIHEYLRRYFLAIAEAAMSDDSPKDVVRCYALESLMLCPVRLEPRGDARNSFEAAWVLLLGTYLSESIEPSVLLQPDTGKRLPNILSRLTKQPNDWKCFLDDIAYYQLKAPSAHDHLASLFESLSELKLTQKTQAAERTKYRDIDNSVKFMSDDAISADKLRQRRAIVAQQAPAARFELDRSRLSEFVRLLGDAADYVLERYFRERETRFLRLETDISRYIEEINRYPTYLSVERLFPFLSNLNDLLKKDFSRVEVAKPFLELRNVLDSDFYVLNDGAVALRLQLASRDESAPPVEAIGLVLEQGEGEPCHSPEPLHGGQSREIELTVRPSAKQIGDRAFTVNVRVEYRTRKDSFEKSQPFSLAVRLGNPAFDEIANPYGRYSGGSPVEDESMFFGRVELVDRVVRYLSTGSMGQCFVLYGQKRSGKSSVLKQVEKRLGKSVLFVSMSAGTFTPSNLWGSFARLLLQQLKFRLEDAGVDLPETWPDQSSADANPLESILEVTYRLAKRGHHIVVAIDEFTYIFENVQKDVIETFMRGWKALLEARKFNALLVGQDTMPRFKQAFPNEFGVTHDERITYLTQGEAESLASQPILLDGLSRYRGQALSRLFNLTAGSPFFLQIACDELLRHLNTRKAAFVTEADIDQVTRTLTRGGDALPPERFDALVTAAGEKVAYVPRDDLWRLLARVARESLHSGWCFRNTLSELPKNTEAVRDLIDREILAVEGERVSIRVGLFAAWLRANQ
jgi:hypothetical protein